ncbi:MAG: LacI family transcriptional regulator [Clostridiales Family XIII bacterium]|nr:LacI family transcriptional regulator [Clostridiales Family XIII bacterium]
MGATIKDIANKTGLGIATISKYINGGNVLPENRVKIDSAIAELDYTPNNFARSLKTQRSKMIGIVIPVLNNSFFMQIITRMEYILKKEGYAVIISDCQESKDQERESIRFLMNKNVDGIISFPVSGSGTYLSPAIEKGIPIVLIDRLVQKLHGKVDSVSIDNAAISREAIDLLLKNGHRRIAIIAGPKGTYTSDKRLQGYIDALRQAGIGVDEGLVSRCEYTAEGAYKAFQTLMKKNGDITALYATNHDMTLGALMAIKESKHRIPSDISFIGFDSMDWAKITVPPLTIVEQPMEQMGTVAATIMLRRISGMDKDMPSRDIMMSASLNMGESVKNLNSAARRKRG